MRLLILLLSACITTGAYAKTPKTQSLASCYYVATLQVAKLNPLQFKPVFKRVSRQSYQAIESATVRNWDFENFKKRSQFLMTLSAPCQSFQGVFEARKTLERMLYNKWAIARLEKTDLCCWPTVPASVPRD